MFLDNDKFPELNKKIDEIAKENRVSNTAIVIAWILRHPVKIKTIVGTTNKKRIQDIARASEIEITRQQWHEIYRATGNKLP